MLLYALLASAQQEYDKMETDAIYKLAREKAFAGQYAEARKLCSIALARNPDYHDVRVLLGRTYAWDGKREEARKEFRAVLAKDPKFTDAALALTDVELWDGKPERAEEEAGKGLVYEPNNTGLLIRKAKALKDQEKYEAALLVISRIEELDPACSECAALRRAIQIASFRHVLGANYALDYYSVVFDPMHYAYVQAATTNHYGTAIARLNYAHRFSVDGIQPEIDLYPKIRKGMYAYLNYGYSWYGLFPRNRVGAELYSKLPRNFEISAGIRYLDFGPSANVMIYTGSLSKYYGNYLFTARPYYTPGSGRIAQAYAFMARRYFGDADNYISLHFGAGFSPDQRRLQTNVGLDPGNNIYLLHSQRAELQFQKSLSIRVLFQGGVQYTHQELNFSYGNYVDVFGFNTGIRVKL